MAAEIPAPKKGAQTMLQLRKKTKRRKNPKRASIHSTMTTDQKRALTDLVLSLAALGDRAAAGLEARLRTVLEKGEEMPDLRLLLKLFERLLRRTARDLDDTDAGGWKREMSLRALRFECARVKKEVRASAVTIRKALVELVGSKPCRFQFGLSLRTPRGAADLAIEVRRLVSRLAHHGLKLPKSLLPGLEADPEGWVAELEPGLERLERLLHQIDLQRIAVSDGVIARRKAIAASAETYRLVMGASETLFALAGEKELARCLRFKRRRRRVKPRRKRLRSAAVTLFEWLRRLVGRFRSTAACTRKSVQLSRVSEEARLAAVAARTSPTATDGM